MQIGSSPERALAWRPLTAVWDVTRACDRGCLHPRTARDLGQREALALIPQLVELAPRLLVMSGDDALQRPGLDDLIAAAVAAGLRVGLELSRRRSSRRGVCGGSPGWASSASRSASTARTP